MVSLLYNSDIHNLIYFVSFQALYPYLLLFIYKLSDLQVLKIEERLSRVTKGLDKRLVLTVVIIV